MGNLASAEPAAENAAGERGYLSDGGPRSHKSGRRRRRKAAGHERKKGTPWTEEEHRTFLEGLEKLGKGDWRGISRKFVITRTPTQVASHAQKYFIRQSVPSNKKRRSSLFDVIINDSACICETVPMVSLNKTQKGCNDIDLLCQVNKTVGTPELNSRPPSPPAPERDPGLHFMANHSAVSVPNNINFMWCNHPCLEQARESDFSKDRPTSAEPKISQTLTFMLDGPKSADSIPSKMHTHQSAPSLEFVQLFPCQPSQANTTHEASKSNDLELSIAPPVPIGLRKLSPQNGIGAISVV